MKKNSRVVVNTVLLITAVLIVTFSFFVMKIEGSFTDYYSRQLDNYGNIIGKTVEMAEAYTDTYQQLLTDDLYFKLSALNQELQDVPHEDLTEDRLISYKEKYELYGLAIFIKNDEGISIYNSTVKEEIGVETYDWGYWDDAFQSLFRGEAPTVDRGVARGNFWVGPRSKSYYLPGYYRFAYIYNSNHNYLINGFIEDNNSYNANIKDLLDDLFIYFNEELSYIDAISLIDLAAWEKAYYNGFRNPEDPALIYGNLDRNILINSNLTPQDLSSIVTSRRINVNFQGRDMSVFLIAAGQEEHKYLIAALINDYDKQLFWQQAGFDFFSLAMITIAAVLLGIMYILKKYSSLLTFQIERNEAIGNFSKSIAALPEFVYKCKLDNKGELLLTYNDGRIIEEDKYVALESSYCPMTDVYPLEYVREFKRLVLDVFNGESKRFEINYNGEHYEHFVSPIVDEGGRVSEIIGFATNITDRRLAEEQSKYLATHDPLTDLMNRMAFEEVVKERIEGCPDGKYAIMFLDLNGFKVINDTHGHIIGDMTLQEVAKRIGRIVDTSPDALVARMGGDEFAIILPYGEKEEIDQLAKRIIQDVSEAYIIKDNHIHIGISIGISIYGQDSTIFKQLIHFADMAMYEAKDCRDSYFRFFTKDLLEETKINIFES